MLYTERYVSFTIRNIGKYSLNCTAYGKTDATVAATATWFFSLKDSEESNTRLRIFVYNIPRTGKFNLGAMPSEQLTRILESIP